MERTEVYEYVLSLTSGVGQPDFQVGISSSPLRPVELAAEASY